LFATNFGRRGLALVLGFALTGTLGIARAEPTTETRELARGLADEGANAYAAGDDERALTLFQQAYRLVPAPTVALFEARTLVRLGRWREARAAYARLSQTELGADAPKAFRAAVEAGQAERAALERRLATTRTTRRARVAPPPPTAPDPRRTWGFIGLGIGGAGLALGVAGGFVALDAHRDAERGCPASRCVAGTPGARDAERFRDFRTVSTLGYVIGGVGLGAGAALLLTSGRDRSTQLALVPTLSGARLGAAW
jgi:hypothetical protein